MLGTLGLNGVGTDPDTAADPRLLAASGIPYTDDGIYAPPGAEPGTGLTLNTSYMRKWAAAHAGESTRNTIQLVTPDYKEQPMPRFICRVRSSRLRGRLWWR